MGKERAIFTTSCGRRRWNAVRESLISGAVRSRGPSHGRPNKKTGSGKQNRRTRVTSLPLTTATSHPASVSRRMAARLGSRGGIDCIVHGRDHRRFQTERMTDPVKRTSEGNMKRRSPSKRSGNSVAGPRSRLPGIGQPNCANLHARATMTLWEDLVASHPQHSFGSAFGSLSAMAAAQSEHTPSTSFRRNSLKKDPGILLCIKCIEIFCRLQCAPACCLSVLAVDWARVLEGPHAPLHRHFPLHIPH